MEMVSMRWYLRSSSLRSSKGCFLGHVLAIRYVPLVRGAHYNLGDSSHLMLNLYFALCFLPRKGWSTTNKATKWKQSFRQSVKNFRQLWFSWIRLIISNPARLIFFYSFQNNSCSSQIISCIRGGDFVRKELTNLNIFFLNWFVKILKAFKLNI